MQSQIDLKDILRTLNNRIGLIIGVFVLFVVMSIIISYSIAPTYQASATLRIKQKQGLGNSLLSEIPGGNNLTKELMSTYAEMLKSRAVVQVVIDKTWRAKKVGDVAPTVSDFALLITTTPIRDTQILKVSVTGGEPQIAQLRTNTLVEAFLDRLAKLSQEDQRSVREFIGVRLGEIKTDLDKTEAVLTEYKAANKIISPDDEAQAVLDNLKELDKAQANNIVATTSAQAQLRIANSQLESESPGFVASSPLIEQLKGKIADLEVQKMMLLQQYTSKHPQVQTIQAAIDEARSNLNSEANNIVMARAPSSNPVHIALIQAKIQSEASVEAGKAQSVAIKGEVDKRLNALTAMPDKQAKLVRLTRDAKVTEQMYIMMAQRYEEARINEVMTPRDVQVVDDAELPIIPISPKKFLNVSIAALLGLFVGLGLAFMLEYLRRTIRTTDDVEHYLKLPVLGQIPNYNAKRQNIYGRIRDRL